MSPDLANLPKDFIRRDCPKYIGLPAAPSDDLRSSPSAAPAQKSNPESRVRPHQATLAARRKPSGVSTLAARREPSGTIHLCGTARGRVPGARPRCGRITPPKGRDQAIVDFFGNRPDSESRSVSAQRSARNAIGNAITIAGAFRFLANPSGWFQIDNEP